MGLMYRACRNKGGPVVNCHGEVELGIRIKLTMMMMMRMRMMMMVMMVIGHDDGGGKGS